MSSCANLKDIIIELAQDAEMVEQEGVEAVEQLIVSSHRVFVAGAGRSGFAASAFSNRLMHLGLDSHFVGEPTCPSIREGDVLVVGSGSGMTEGMVIKAKKAKSEGAKVATITINPDGEIAKIADAVILIPGKSTLRMKGGSAVKAPSIQPDGSSFEQLSWLTYDSMVIDLMRLTKSTQEDMNHRHSNLE